MKLTAVFQKVSEGYIGFVEEVPGANTQGETLEEVRANLSEAVSMVLDANREAGKSSTIPRHRELNEFLARKICKDLEVPQP